MTVDMLDMRNRAIDYTVSSMKEAVDAFQHLSLLDVGVVLIGVGVLAGLNAVYQDWRKKKGYRMVLRDRNDKAHALLTQIINDGLFEAECANKISNKEVLDLYREMSKKLDLPDLVPKKHRLKIVKEELKRARFSKQSYADWKKSRMPKKFSEVIGTFANKYWKKAA